MRSCASRVWGDSARRVAQFQSHYLHHSIEEPFRRRGLNDNEASRRRSGGRRSSQPLGEELLSWLLRRHAEVFETEHLFEHVETALEDAGVYGKAPAQVEACAFADLSGYTKLTEEVGDEAAADVSVKLATGQ